MILRLKDGEIIDIKMDSYKLNGCDTCDYGSEYIQDMYIETTKYLTKE